MIEFLINYWYIIIAVVAIITGIIVLWRNGYKTYIAKILFFLVTQAEKQYGSGTGDLKYAAVTTWLYEKMPIAIRFLFSPKVIDELIEKAVIEMKEYLKKNTQANILITTIKAE